MWEEKVDIKLPFCRKIVMKICMIDQRQLKRTKYNILVGISIMWFCCKEPYLPPEIANTKNYLVVDGTLHIGSDSTYIMLSRTRSLQDSVPNIPELNAQVEVIGQNGEQYPLIPMGNGVYATDYIGLKANERCQLSIHTADGKSYLADSIQVLSSPPIDSVSWKQDSTSADSKKGVTIYVATHDPTNSTLYYRWEYIETYEYHSKYDALMGKFVCWKSRPSTELVLATSAGLRSDLIFEQPLIFIAQGSQSLGVKYSILVKQTALTKPAYDYFQNLRKNTELTGSIFDPQPSQSTGNIRCLNDPAEPVLGYVYASTEQQQRIFIDNDTLAHWGYVIMGCNIIVNPGTTLGLVFLYQLPPPMGGSAWATLECADCTLQGGTTTKPDFWP
ncbi:MAG: DUF4249 domain-containing protein [Chitinophagales bacterium]